MRRNSTTSNPLVTDAVTPARLSYFLWNTLPDDELLSAATKGDLNDRQMLAGQVERMLNHEKARGFHFAVSTSPSKWARVGGRVARVEHDDRI